MRSFFDTNVLVYLFDSDTPVKQRLARSLLTQEAAAGRVLLSTQVLQEFFVTVTRKLAVPLASELAENAVSDLSNFSIVRMDPQLILAAISLNRRLSLSFWDALIVQAALQGGAGVLYTEDLQDGQFIEGMRISNPFRQVPSRPCSSEGGSPIGYRKART